MFTSPDAIGPNFQLSAMLSAQHIALQALQQIAEQITVGMSEYDANQVAEQVLKQAGYQQHWHPAIVRFGVNTLKMFFEKSVPDVTLQDGDIFFIDLGPVFNGHEADVGASFVCCAKRSVAEQNPLYQAGLDVVNAVETVFANTAQHWQHTGCSGQALYAYAEQQAQALGMVLNHQIKGHRVGDFPHKMYANAKLGEQEIAAIPGIWVLEIQLRHPTLPLGAFKEWVLF